MKEREPIRKPVLREDFGPTSAGEQVYQTILQGVGCETILEETGRLCGITADRSVDYDASGNFEFVAVCGSEHAGFEVKKLREEAKRTNKYTVLSSNGFGREVFNPGL